MQITTAACRPVTHERAHPMQDAQSQPRCNGLFVPVVRAHHLQTLLRQIESLGLPTDRLVHESGIHPSACEDANFLLPEKRLWTVLHALRAGDGPAMPARAGFGPRNRVFELGLFDRSVFPTLAALLRQFCAGMRRHTNRSDFFLSLDSDGGTLGRLLPPLRDGAWPVEQYLVSAFVDLVQMASGDEWWPDDVWLLHRGPLHREEQEWLGSARVHLGTDRTAISVPTELLSRPCFVPARYVVRNGRTGPAEDSPSAGLREALRLAIRSGDTAIDRVANDAGMSARTFQRRLRDRGTSFQTLLNETRFELAADALASSDQPVTTVALELGYENPAAFSRAFRAWAGRTPSQFRRERMILARPASSRGSQSGPG